MHERMLYAVVFLSALGIVPTVDGADKITGDAADALEFLGLQYIVQMNLAVSGWRQRQFIQLLIGLLFYIADVLGDFCLRYIAETIDSYCYIIYHHDNHLSFYL